MKKIFPYCFFLSLYFAVNCLAQVTVDGSGLMMDKGTITANRPVVMGDSIHASIPANLWAGQHDGKIKICDSDGNCVNRNTFSGGEINEIAVYNGRIWVGQENGYLYSCDSALNCPSYMVMGSAISALEIFDGKLWIGLFSGSLRYSTDTSSYTPVDLPEPVYAIWSMAVYDGRIWIGDNSGGLFSCDGDGACRSHGDQGGGIVDMSVFEGRLWLAQDDGHLRSCNGSGACTDMGDQEEVLSQIEVFADHLWLGTNAGNLIECDSQGNCDNQENNLGAPVWSMSVFEGHMFVSDGSGTLWRCRTNGSCGDLGDKGEPVEDMVLFTPASLGNTLYTQAGQTGIGTTEPYEELDIMAEDGTPSLRLTANNGEESSLQLYEVTGGSFYGWEFLYSGSSDKLHLYSRGFSGNEGIRMTWRKDGHVGIGQTNPQYPLDVTGSVNVTGSYLTNGSDYAEVFPSSRPCSPGQVVSLHQDKNVYPAVRGDPFVLGIVSENPSVLGNAGLETSNSVHKVPVALLGRVMAKVTGTVRFGDWLTVSDTPGTLRAARKDEERIARAMETGTGSVEVFLFGGR